MEAVKKMLEKQHYCFLGEHSALKVCSWTKKSLRDEGVCYKEKFYGIRSHLCAQISPIVNFCNHDCVFCWRDKGNWEVKKLDEPSEIISGIAQAQKKMLTGFNGYDGVNKDKLEEASDPQHIAISLTGEILAYKKISELIKGFHEAGKTTFVVTNGTFPDVLRKMEMPTQLYISIEAPNKELYKKIDKPLFQDTWDKLMDSLDIMKNLKTKTRTALRITAIKDLNMIDPEGYAKLIEKADATFVEVKSYMYVGASQQKLEIENMPRHPEVKEFAEEIAKHCGYKIIDEQKESRVVLLMKEDFDGRVMKF
ncbi:MAG: 4-demethylwyosine synthase TYW1 [archaeon]